MYIKDLFKRLQDPIIFTATISNTLTILVLVGIIGDIDADTYTKVLTSLTLILLQLGILKQPNSTK
jgi:hypothetical protein